MTNTMRLDSPAFGDHESIPSRYSHEAGDVSPPLEWSGVPERAAELALLCEDPDALGGPFVHWLVAGIPPTEQGLEAGVESAAVASGRNGFGSVGYGGPHPPPGDDPHLYRFRLLALSEPSGLGPGFTADDLRPHLLETVAEADLVGLYSRPAQDQAGARLTQHD